MPEPTPADRMLRDVAQSLRQPPADPDEDAERFATVFEAAAGWYERGHRDPLVLAVIGLAAHLCQATVVQRDGP